MAVPPHSYKANLRNSVGPAPAASLAVSPLPPSPRILSRHAFRQSWFLPQVRAWWLMMAAVLVVAIGVAIVQYQNWDRDAQLIHNGLHLQAKLLGVPGTSRGAGKMSFPGQVVEFELWQNDKPVKRANDTPYILSYRLPVQGKAWKNTELYPIVVDRNNWDNFTLQTVVRPLMLELMGAFTLVPLIIVLAVICLFKRRTLLRIWSHGDAHEAVVIDAVRAGAAPDARLVRCTLKLGNDQRVLRVLVPRAISIQPGDSLWLLTPPNALEPALPAICFPN